MHLMGRRDESGKGSDKIQQKERASSPRATDPLSPHPDLLQALEVAEQRYRLAPPESAADKAKDQVINALRRRLDEMKQQLAAKDQALRGKQREIDRLYGKLPLRVHSPMRNFGALSLRLLIAYFSKTDYQSLNLPVIDTVGEP